MVTEFDGTDCPFYRKSIDGGLFKWAAKQQNSVPIEVSLMSFWIFHSIYSECYNNFDIKKGLCSMASPLSLKAGHIC